MKEKLIGVWSLVSSEHLLSEGGKILPFGDDPLGTLIYTAEGTMSVMLGARNRKPFAIDGLFAGSLEEKAAAIESFVAYSGTYEVTPTEVLHHVKMSLFPNWVGTTQTRFWKFDNDRLTLTTETFVSRKKEQTAQIVWARGVSSALQLT